MNNSACTVITLLTAFILTLSFTLINFAHRYAYLYIASVHDR